MINYIASQGLVKTAVTTVSGTSISKLERVFKITVFVPQPSAQGDGVHRTRSEPLWPDNLR